MKNAKEIKRIILPRDEFKPAPAVEEKQASVSWPIGEENIVKIVYNLQQDREEIVQSVLDGSAQWEQEIYKKLINLWHETEEDIKQLMKMAQDCPTLIRRHWIYIMIAEHWITQGDYQKQQECLDIMEEKEEKEEIWGFTQQYQSTLRAIGKVKHGKSQDLNGKVLKRLKMLKIHPQLKGMQAYTEALKGEDAAQRQQYIKEAIEIFSEQGASPNVYWWAKSVIERSKYEEEIDRYELSLAINKLRKMGKPTIAEEGRAIILSKEAGYRESRHLGKYVFGSNQALKDKIKRLAQSEQDILILGETGTGKTLIAKEIHSHPLSPRRERQFVSVNCGSLRPEIALAELCGTAKGGFTNATERRGLIEEAGNGTLFLDEIGELPAEIQAMLLTAISEKKIRRIGSNREIEVKCRIIGATNRDIINNVSYEDKHDNPFREDLVARFKRGIVTIEPLRERKEDINELATHFIKEMKDIKIKFGLLAVEEFQKYDFPGNIRELKQIMEEIIEECKETYQLELINEMVITQPMTRKAISKTIIKNNDEIKERSLVPWETTGSDQEILLGAIKRLKKLSFEQARDSFCQLLIAHALNLSNNKTSRSAEILEVTRFRLNDMIKRYEIK
jgi:DNA-binding NtrC family response regulator